MFSLITSNHFQIGISKLIVNKTPLSLFSLVITVTVSKEMHGTTVKLVKHIVI